MNVVALIPARLASSRLPQKLIKELLVQKDDNLNSLKNKLLIIEVLKDWIQFYIHGIEKNPKNLWLLRYF